MIRRKDGVVEEESVPWWPELRDLVGRLEAAAAALEDRPARPLDELCDLVERRSGTARKGGRGPS